MSNFKFDLDPKNPSPEMLEKHRDFGKVLENYQRMTHPLYKTPLYRFKRIGIAVLLVLSVTWMVIEFGGKDQQEQHTLDSLKHVKDSLNAQGLKHSDRN